MKTFSFFIIVILLFASGLSPAAASPVPDRVPDDIGCKTPFGYLMSIKTQYLPAGIFTQKDRYSEEDLENARRAARLLAAAATEAMAENGAEDPHNLYMRAEARLALYQDTQDPEMKLLALDDFEKAASLAPAYAQAVFGAAFPEDLRGVLLERRAEETLSARELSALAGLSEDTLVLSSAPFPQGGQEAAEYRFQNTEASKDAAAEVRIVWAPAGGPVLFLALSETLDQGSLGTPAGPWEEALQSRIPAEQGKPAREYVVLARKGALVCLVGVTPAFLSPGSQSGSAAALAEAIAARALVRSGNPGFIAP